jgi:hypothetical protein
VKALLAVLLLAGCATAQPPRAVPAALQVCPDPGLAPRPLPPVRTVEALGAWGVATNRALRETIAALAECSDRLARRNALDVRQ